MGSIAHDYGEVIVGREHIEQNRERIESKKVKEREKRGRKVKGIVIAYGVDWCSIYIASLRNFSLLHFESI